MLAVRERQAEVGERFLDVVLEPAGELAVFTAPFAKPGGEIAPSRSWWSFLLYEW